MIMAGNQVGKTVTAAVLIAYHLTGRYPPLWNGIKLNQSLIVWGLGVSGEQIKEVSQTKLFGEFNETIGKFEGGFIPADAIIYSSIIKSHHTKGLIKEVKIQHINGHISLFSFKSYEQKQQKFMGQIIDIVWIDEEPKDSLIYPQLVTRTINGLKKEGGHIYITFTPENGMTHLANKFINEIADHQFYMNIIWDDALHFTEARKKEMRANYTPDQLLMREKGQPMLGSGIVYLIDDERIKYDGMEMQAHWPRLNAIDFGIKHCALAWGAYDRDADIIYIYDVLLATDLIPVELSLIMRGKNKNTLWVWPHDGHLPTKNTGEEQKELYVKAGVKMHKTHVTSLRGGYGVEASIMECFTRMRTGRLKIASHLADFFTEKRLYHRKDHKIVKENDHVLDAVRYLVMMIRYASTDIENKAMHEYLESTRQQDYGRISSYGR